MDVWKLIEKLDGTHSLTTEEYEMLLRGRTQESQSILTELAVRRSEAVFGNRVFIRGLIEVSSHCKNGCSYCGINRENRNCRRCRLTPEQILACANDGWELGFRTVVLQGGEDGWFTDDRVCHLLKTLKARHPDCAVTLSLGERSRESYERLHEAGADRYLLRHETADKAHYARLHPSDMDYDRRMACLRDLHEIGYQTGCGFMVGSPGQTLHELAEDLKFVETFSPEMCGIGPFIPHKNTRFRSYLPGSVELTCYLLSILRIMKPTLLLPATTALGTLDEQGREKGIRSGANVVMPNLSPPQMRQSYMLYDNKLSDGAEAARNLEELKWRMQSIGYEIVVDRGDYHP